MNPHTDGKVGFVVQLTFLELHSTTVSQCSPKHLKWMGTLKCKKKKKKNPYRLVWHNPSPWKPREPKLIRKGVFYTLQCSGKLKH